jgi:signal transduction histidine kinase/ActR/RegA family two-component response regulator
MAAVVEIMDGRQIGGREYTALRKDGTTFPVIVHASSVMSGDRPVGLRGIVIDLTELREAQEELRRKEEQLRESQKMEAIGRLAGGVAHDFNNLLTVISGHSQLMLEKLGESEPLHRSAGRIYTAAERAATLTRQLLAFSRRQVLEPEVLDLNAVVADMDKILRRVIGEDIDLLTVLDPDLGRTKADRGQIEQVILNLAVNARDAMPQGGKLTLETSNVHLGEEYAGRHVAVTPGPHVMLAVSDSGIGMDEETKSQVFEPFFTTKEGATGLGLATVYGTVKQSGGNIWVYSEPGQGTVFKVYLPRVEGEAELPKPTTIDTDALRGTETILVVEDEDMVRELTREILRMKGYTVIDAGNPSEAILTCERHEGRIDLMLTDVVMPQMSGREVAEKVVALRPDMKVLYMSGYTDNAIVHQGALDPGVAFIHKPFAPDSLAGKVREVLDAPTSKDAGR